MRFRHLLLMLFAFPVGLAAAAEPQTQRRQPPPAMKKLGILVYPGVEVIDFATPYDILSKGMSKRQRLFDVVTVGLTMDMIRTGPEGSGLKMIPDYSIDNCPKLDIVVIPGGETAALSKDAKAMDWIAKAVNETECVMSVCNAAFVLAKGGHLKGQSATTYFYFLEELKKDEPTCNVVYDRRVVDNGKIVTTAGLSSAIEGALHLVERYGSPFDAEQLALNLEYHWEPDLNYARANLGDRYLLKMLGAGLTFPKGGVKVWTVVENNGSALAWTKRWTFESGLKREELLKVVETKAAQCWTRNEQRADESAWKFKDDHNRAWTASVQLTSPAERHWELAIRLERSK